MEAPEGRLTIARRFSAGNSGKSQPVPEGRLKVSRTLFSPWETVQRQLEFFTSVLARYL